MVCETTLKQAVLAALTLTLVACGGSSNNTSPGSIVVGVPTDPTDPTDPVDPTDPTDPTDPGGDVIASVIPDGLDGVITDSGRVINGRSVYTIDVTALDGGRLDPTGLLLGNDAIFEITGGGPMRVAPPASGACSLELAPGAIVAGSTNTEFVVIEQGCQIDADGTAEQPIVFTSMADVEGTVADSARGLWGGLVINGFAPINDCPEGATGGTAQCTKEGEANSGLFGGDQPDDNSGTLRYVTVRYAGSNVDPENQLNGIAFQGVGSQTTVEYVQVHNNLDDGIEFFGGTVSARYVVLTGNADDSLDWTDGWQGSIQYLYIEQTDSADNAIEADNREGDEDAAPRSLPSIANMSVYGNPAENALRLRRGTGLFLYNSFVEGSESCIRVDGRSRDLLGSDLTIAGTSLSCVEVTVSDDDGAVAAYLDSADEVSVNGGDVNPVTPMGDFENAAFIGAIGPNDWTAGWTVAGSVSNSGQPDFGCPEGTSDTGNTISGKAVCSLSGEITSDMTLASSNYYQLDGKVTVGGDNTNSAVLRIQPGTTVFGGTSFDFLVISRGSQLIANGTRNAPVVFTSIEDETLGGSADIETSRGLWGGLVINGNAPINDCPEGAAGGTDACTKEGEANSGTFGGSNPADNSGVLNYVVVKYAGSNVDPENQLNGIAFQGVGSGTAVNFVQVHNNLDDGVEFFGGTVSAKYMVLTGNADDSLDWTDGWQGDIQYLLIQQADGSADNGIEADNREGDENAMPRSLPRIANMTIKGNSGENGIRLRRGTGLELFNSIVTGSNSCLRIQGESLNLLGSGVEFDGVSFGCATTIQGDDVPAIESLLNGSNVSQSGDAVAAADLAGDAYFDATAFVGAVEDSANDWTTGWAVGMPDAEVAFGCPAGSSQISSIDFDTPTCQLSGEITSDITLTRGNYYVLDGKVTVGGDNTNSAVMTIESGVTVIGDDAEDFLVISRGSQLVANGTNNSPVVMTASRDIVSTPGANDRGLWGGLVINGNAPINDCPEGAEGGSASCTKEGEANSGLFGGDMPQDSSGVLKYLVVKYAGSNVDPENQLNGIAFQGVGSGTEVDYIQVHNNLDDGVEFFGGTVSARHVILTGNADDSLDWTDGWTGNVQYLHIEQSADSADSAIEADNREGDELATPVSGPSIANMTIVGNADERAIRLRRGTGLKLFNSVVTNSANCVRVQGESENLYNTGITFQSVSLDCATIAEGDDVAALQTFLDGSPNVTQDGSTPPAASLPENGFFEQSGSVGSDVDSWKGNWAFGL
tara:strand:- start:41199 stop:45011 length:3813 start_codon:yes stop_codon:yes gene_type:complete